MIAKVYVNLVRGFDPDFMTGEFQNFSEAKYTLPEYFQNGEKWTGRAQQWHDELMVHIGETFNYQWAPVGVPQYWTKEEWEYHTNV